MVSRPRSRFKFFRTSLRVRVALCVALPLFVALTLLSLMHYWHERRLLEDQIQLIALQSCGMLTSRLRHSMMSNDFATISQSLADVGSMEAVERVQIIGLNGQVKVDSDGGQVGLVRQIDDPGCRECHQFSCESRPRTMRLTTSADVLRISTPIYNEPGCTDCHPLANPHIGVLLADVSIASVESRLLANLAGSAGVTVLVIVGIYLLIHWLVVRRVETFCHPLAEFASGDLSSRLPSPAGPTDELGKLANAVNRMMDELEHQAREQEERDKLRVRAIVEERSRIARELHDGLAQLLGYVNAKATTVRQVLRERQVEAANQHLLQLEKATQTLQVDLREAITGLKMGDRSNINLVTMLRDLATQFSLLSDLPVEIAFAPAVENLSLGGETELQLSRVVQESLTNIRKHAGATRVWLSMRVDDSVLGLTVCDDGRGFDLDRVLSDRRPCFGLSTMRERVEAIGAEFNLESKPGVGTRIMVRLPFGDAPGAREWRTG